MLLPLLSPNYYMNGFKDSWLTTAFCQMFRLPVWPSRKKNLLEIPICTARCVKENLFVLRWSALAKMQLPPMDKMYQAVTWRTLRDTITPRFSSLTLVKECPVPQEPDHHRPVEDPSSGWQKAMWLLFYLHAFWRNLNRLKIQRLCTWETLSASMFKIVVIVKYGDVSMLVFRCFWSQKRSSGMPRGNQHVMFVSDFHGDALLIHVCECLVCLSCLFNQ